MYENLFYWGFLPYVAAQIGFFLPVLLFDFIFWDWFQTSRFTFNRDERRHTLSKNSESKSLSYWQQFRLASWEIAGPSNVLASLVSALLLGRLSHPNVEVVDDRLVYPDVINVTHWVHFILLYIMGDLGLYIGHRLLHENQWLWQKHALHHSVKIPFAVSTLYIDPIDKTLQGGLPILIAGLLVQPNAWVFTFYTCIRVAENVVNHTGIMNVYLDIFTLKFLPFRGSVAHHDSHHYFSGGTTTGAKNFGEGFWVWDWLFGSYRDSSKIIAAAA